MYLEPIAIDWRNVSIKEMRTIVTALGAFSTTMAYIMTVVMSSQKTTDSDSSGENQNFAVNSLLEYLMGLGLSSVGGGIVAYCGYTIYHRDYFNLTTNGLFKLWPRGPTAPEDIENKTGAHVNENSSLLSKPTGQIN